MKVLIIHQYYYPDISANSQYITDLAVDLVERGHHVSVVASSGVLHGAKTVAPRFERVQGVDVYRTPATNLGKGTLAARVFDYASFLLSATLRSARLPAQDVVLILTTPPLLPALGPALRSVRGTRFVYLSEDVYPDIAIEMGVMRERSALTSAVRSVVRWSQRRADRVVVIGRCMRDRFQQEGLDPARMSLIPNWADPREIYAVPEEANPMIGELGLAGRFRLAYSGNMGWGHEFGTFLAAAERLREDPAVRFVFIGEGYRKKEIAAHVESASLSNVTLLPYQPREKLIHSLNIGDVSLVSQRREVDGLLVPSKLYALLAAAKPVLFVGSETCEVGRTLLESACGFVFREGDVDGLVSAIERLRDEPALRKKMGESGRDAFLAKYQRRHAVDAYERLFQDLVAEQRGAA